jgi:hypothetical protein
MKTITQGMLGAALAAGLALGGGVAANAAEAGTPVAANDESCSTELSATERSDGYTEYDLSIACDELPDGVWARAVLTFENEDGTKREVRTAFVDDATGSASIRVATKAKAVDVRIERATRGIPVEG